MPQPLISLDTWTHANPCAEPWNAMPGDDWKRHCEKCDQNVYNLSAMTRGEAERLLVRHEGRICTTFYRRPDGSILTQRCPSSIRKALLRIGRWGLAAGLAVPAFAHNGMACPRGEILIERRPADADGPVIAGVVTDALGAVIAGARVSIEDSEAEPMECITDSAGRFAVNDALPESFAIRAWSEGFKTLLREEIVRAAGESLEVQAKLEIGSVGGGVAIRRMLPANPVRWPNSLMRWFRRKLR